MSCVKDGKVRWVWGNTRTVAITLEQVTDVKTGETAAFDIEEGDVVTVNIRGALGSTAYEPAVSGNVLTFKVGAELGVGQYVVEVSVRRGSETYVSRKRWQLAVVRYDDEAGIPDGAEFSPEEVELIAAMYIKGDMFRYEDMTEVQKDDLSARVADDMGGRFSVDDDGYLCYDRKREV